MPKLFPYFQYSNFLEHSDLVDLISFTLKNESSFDSSKVRKSQQAITDPTIRDSWTSFETGFIEKLFTQKIETIEPVIFRELNMTSFDVQKYEFQMSAHGNGSFFRQHIDTIIHQSDEKSNRAVSLVFYYYPEPKAFKGGELVLHPLHFLPGNDQPVVISPINNTLVAFPSIAPHEVLPVSVEKNLFSHYRFSVNCWLHK